VKKRVRLNVLCFLMVLTMLLLVGCAGGETKDERERIADFPAAAFEYAEDQGYKLITSEIGSLATFASIDLRPSDEAFEGDWIYRITFNPKVIMPESEEFVVLFGENSVSVNGKTYVPGEGVAYEDVLNWAAGKYEYFDYELQQD